MLHTSEALQQLIEEFSRLPGIGRKSAQRLALHLLKQPREDVVRMARTLVNMKDRIRYCSICWNITAAIGKGASNSPSELRSAEGSSEARYGARKKKHQVMKEEKL